MNDDKETQDEIFSQTIYESAKAFIESGQAASPGVKNSISLTPSPGKEREVLTWPISTYEKNVSPGIRG